MPMWCVASLEMNEGNSLGQGYNWPTGCSAEKAPNANFLKLSWLHDAQLKSVVWDRRFCGR